jgi:chondroitin 4-sulfotransferase 11
MKHSLGQRYRTARRKWQARRYGAFDCDTDIIALHPYRVLYFAVPKVANTSLKAAFSRLLATHLTDVLGPEPDDKARRSLFRRHFRAIMYDRGYLLCKHDIGRYSGYDSFAFVRNPWDRLVSCYTNKLERVDLSNGPQGRDTLESLSKAGYFREDMKFEEFASAVCDIPDENANRHYRSQHTFLSDPGGTLLPRQIYRFEHLAEHFTTLTQHHDLPYVELPHYKPGRRRDYREYYTQTLRDKVAERYRTDIELFGYKF